MEFQKASSSLEPPLCYTIFLFLIVASFCAFLRFFALRKTGRERQPYSFESSWRDLQNLHAFAPSESNLKTGPNSKIQIHVVKHFRIFAMLFSKCRLFLAMLAWWFFPVFQQVCAWSRKKNKSKSKHWGRLWRPPHPHSLLNLCIEFLVKRP